MQVLRFFHMEYMDIQNLTRHVETESERIKTERHKEMLMEKGKGLLLQLYGNKGFSHNI